MVLASFNKIDKTLDTSQSEDDANFAANVLKEQEIMFDSLKDLVGPEAFK
jgi:hypothetical protein